MLSRAVTKKRRGRRLFTALAVASVVAGTFIAAGTALAVHDLHFQLDGDTTSNPFSSPTPNAGLEYDWNNVFTVTTNAPVPPATDGTQTVSPNSANVGSGKTFDAASFTRDFETNATCPTTSAIGLISTSTKFCTGDDTTYATGSKDTLGIGNGGWQCNHDNNVNSKIDIMNAYVLQYTNPVDQHKIFYFGVERNVSNGTNDVGVWFLQTGASCTAPSGSVNFTGQHQDGDTLVVAEQTSGGGVSTAKAFRWAAAASGSLSGDGGCIDSNDNPNPKTGGCNNLPIATGADCKTTGGTDPLCATTNAFCPPPRKASDPKPPCNFDWNKDVTTNWLTANSTVVGNTIVPPDFFEGGIDITAAFSGHAGTAPSCFTTSVPDTRSSASATATLFDFTINQIGGCSQTLSTTKNAAASTQIGVDGTASSGTDTAVLKIAGTANWGGTLTWYLCGPDVTSCDTNGYVVGSALTVANTDNNNCGADCTYTSGTVNVTSAGASTGQYCWHAQFVPDAKTLAAGVKTADDNGVGECFLITPRTPTLATSATCVDSLGITASPCVLGSTLKDTATLTGTANNPKSDGTNLTYPTIGGTTQKADSSITWVLYGPGGSPAGCDTTNTKATSPASAIVSGDGTYGPTSYTPTTTDGVGTYTFVANYGGELPNTLAAATNTCALPGLNETITVTGSLSSSSKQGWLPNDRITLTSTAGTTMSGSVVATLYRGAFGGTLASCTKGTATQVYTQTLTVSSAGNTATVFTTNSSVFVGTNPSNGAAGEIDGDYFWLIHTNISGLSNPSDRCESTTISHNDG